jgi:pimeloyl-ACP methyl ester carboxylesterase
MHKHKTLYATLTLALLLSFMSPNNDRHAHAVGGAVARASYPAQTRSLIALSRQASAHQARGNVALLSAKVGALHTTIQAQRHASDVGPGRHERRAAAITPRDAANCNGQPYLNQNGTQYTIGNDYVYWTFDFDPSLSSRSSLGFPGDLYYDAYGGCSYSYTNIEGSIALSFVENGVRHVYGTPNGEYGSWWSSNAANIPTGTIADSMVPVKVTQDSTPGQDPLVVTFEFLAGDARVDWTLSIGGADKNVSYSVKVTAPGDASISNVSLYHMYDLDDLNGGDSSPGADGQYLDGLLGSVYSLQQGIGIGGYNAQWDLSTEDGSQQSVDDTFQKVVEGTSFNNYPESQQYPTGSNGADGGLQFSLGTLAAGTSVIVGGTGGGTRNYITPPPPGVTADDEDWVAANSASTLPASSASVTVDIKRFYGALQQDQPITADVNQGSPEYGQLARPQFVEDASGATNSATLQLEAYGVRGQDGMVTIECQPSAPSQCQPYTVQGTWGPEDSHASGWRIFTSVPANPVPVSVLNFPNLNLSDHTYIQSPYPAPNTITVNGTGGGTAIAWARITVKGVRPVVLVHGIAPAEAPVVPSSSPLNLGGWNTWKDWVRKDGYLTNIGVPNIRPNEEITDTANQTQQSSDPTSPNHYVSDVRVWVSAFGSYEDNAQQVNDHINMVLKRYGVNKVNVVTHSMGGLDATYAALGDNAKVANVIMLEVPYDGTPLADALVDGPCAATVKSIATGDVGRVIVGGALCLYISAVFSPGAPELTRAYWQQYQSTHHGDLLLANPQTHYYTIAGTDSSAFFGLPGTFIQRNSSGSDNDSIVPASSVMAASDKTKAAGATFLGGVPYTHFNITTQHDIYCQIAPYIALTQASAPTCEVNPFLPAVSTADGHYDQSGPRIVTPSTSVADDATSISSDIPPQFGPPITATIMPGSVVTETFPVASSSHLNVFLSSDQTSVQMTLRDPAGTAITPLDASAQYTETAITGDGSVASYSPVNPLSGTWTAIITQTDPSGTPAHVLLGTSFMSTLTITPSAAALYQPGATTPFSVMLADAGVPVDSATITATTSLSSTTPVTITLTNTGQGVYSGDFGALATPGEYTVNLVATGTDKGAPFALTGLAFFTVATGNASFAGAYAEGATPGDFGLYSSLVITPTIQVNAPGAYSLQGALTDAAGNVVGTAGASAHLDPGASQALGLSFDGKTIGATGKDGPYQLRDLTLTDDSSGSVLTDDEVPLAYTTAPYVAAQFARPLIQILPGTQDMGTNPNAKGQFQNLTVSFTATGALNDSYQVAATLASAQGQYITAVTQSVRLSSAPTQVALQFSGADIAALGIDGPYYVTGVTIVPDSSPTTYVSYPSFWTTQAYSAASFAPPSMTPTGTPVPPTATPANTFAPPAATPTNTTVPPVATAPNTPVPPAAPTSMPNPPVVAPTNTSVPPSVPPTTAPASGVTTRTPAPASTVAHNATIIQPTATRTPISRVAGVMRTQLTCARPTVTRILVNGKALTKGTQLLSGQMVAVRVHAAPRMSVQTLIDLTHMVTTTTGTGRHHKTVKRTVVVGHVAATATTNRTGDATGYARIAYVPATTATVALKVGVHAACGGSATMVSPATRLKPAYVTPMVSVSLPNGKAVSGATIKTNSVIVVRVDAAENTPIKIAVTLRIQGSKESVTYTAPSNARQAEPRTGKLDGYLMEQVRIPYEPRHYKVGATLAVTVSARSTVGKKPRTLTATTGALHVTLQSERPPQRVRHR